MKAEDIIKQLRAVLPTVTDYFTGSSAVSSLTRSGATVTATTSANHGLVSNNYVTITGAYEPNTISSLTRSGDTATATTAADHDLTEIGTGQANIYPFNRATVSGATETDYNGTFNVVSANNRREFSYTVDNAPTTPATGTPVLLQDTGYSGRHQVTVTGLKTFTYTITETPTSPAQGTILAKKEARVSGAVDLSRAFRGYTEQCADEMWCFVIVGDVSVSKDRATLSDSVQTISSQDEFRQRLIEPFSVFVFIPATSSISARPERDMAEDIRAYIYQSLLGVTLPSSLNDAGFSQVSATGDRYVQQTANDAIYIHEFMFERVVDVTYEDTALPDSTVAFRDFNFDAVIDFGIEGTGDLDADIDLDDSPL